MMIFLTISSAVFLFIEITLISAVDFVKHLICGKILSWVMSLVLIFKTSFIGVKSRFLVSMLGKFNFFRLIFQIAQVLLMSISWSPLLMRNQLWDTIIKWIEIFKLSLLRKLPLTKIRTFIHYKKFL